MNRKLQAVFQVRNNVIHSVTGETTIKNAVDKMNIHNIGALLVISAKDKIEGIVSERDVMKKLASTDELVGHLPVRDIMTPREKLVTIEGDESVADIMKLMVDKKVRHLPIIDETGVLQGVIAMRDFIDILLNEAKQETQDMKNFVLGRYPT